MKVNKFYMVIIAVLSVTLLSGFKLGDLKDKVDPTATTCKNAKDKKKCQEKQLKAVAAVVVVTVAAKIIHDLVIEYKSKKIADDKEVSEKYTKDNGSLPANPTVVSYHSSLKPGQVVNTGKPIHIESELNVVPGKKKKNILIEEKIEIFDNEDKTAVIKSLVKPVNAKGEKGGKYQNSFSFTLPKGMPQGVYKIKTTVLIDGKDTETANNEMQVVFYGIPSKEQLVALN